MAFLQLATQVSKPFVVKGFSTITPSSSRKNSVESTQIDKSADNISRDNTLSLL